ncbi:MAG: GNAT family N-acetyltransferase [Hymenobacteraceae bacterium]|nr:GNAT family N-acetyltransferase [Hymenobacteraceae bacterium]
MPNRLALESSPYLLQHAHNPVDWYPWGEEALAKARAEQKPILVSIGYAACHWCHVMEHESFESEAVAAVMNERFVCVKVDREERPDVDAVYMDAVQAMGVRGGWPLNVFLTPEARPFYGLTYAPPQPWTNLLHSVHKAWSENRAQLEASADEFTTALNADELAKYGLSREASPTDLNGAALNQAFFRFQEGFDRARGGTDRAPKFPMPAHYAWLLRYHARTGATLALDHTLLTLREMARGGLYDQVGGGWAGYSVDADWFAPHFEKMLYDNGQLLTAYAEAYQVSRDPELRAAAALTINWLGRELRAPNGGLYASLDADSEGVEGKFYVFTWAELAAVFPLESELRLVAAYYHATEAGNWEHGANILHRRGADAQFAARHDLTLDELTQRAVGWRADLRAAREPRPHPGLDDKLLTGWNGLALRGLCDAHRAFGDAEALGMALGVGEFLVASLRETPDGLALRRNLKPGGAPQPGFLEDYAAVADGLAALYQLTFDGRWLTAADGLLRYALAHFVDPTQPTGPLFYTDDTTAAPLIARKRELFDNVIPASNSALARALRTVGLLTANRAYVERARALLAAVRPLVEKEPGFLANWAALYEEELTPGAEIVIVGPEVDAFRREIGRFFLPGAVLAGSAEPTDALALLAGKTAIDGRTAIYVCFHGACQRPVFSVAEAVPLVASPPSPEQPHPPTPSLLGEGPGVRLLAYAPAHRLAFRDLNRAWIERYFTLEPHDHEMLDDPEGYILAGGGHILMAELDGQIVGTVALIKETDDRYELAKMAVTDAAQGRGVGRALAVGALAKARALGATRVVLESNRRLAPALALYRSLGFAEVPMPADTPYARADIRMEMALNGQPLVPRG